MEQSDFGTATITALLLGVWLLSQALEQLLVRYLCALFSLMKLLLVGGLTEKSELLELIIVSCFGK